MTTHPVLRKFERCVCLFVVVTRGWLVESLFIKGFFFTGYFPSRAVSLFLAKYSIVVYFDTVEETPAGADFMKTRDKWASNTSLICSLTIFIISVMDNLQLQKAHVFNKTLEEK